MQRVTRNSYQSGSPAPMGPSSSPNELLGLAEYARERLQLAFDPLYNRIELREPEREIIEALVRTLRAHNAYVAGDALALRICLRTIVTAMLAARLTLGLLGVAQ